MGAMVSSTVLAAMVIAAICALIGSYDVSFYLEKTMAVMMILMVVFLVVGGPGAHMGSHDANSSPSQTAQSHEHDSAKTDTEKP